MLHQTHTQKRLRVCVLQDDETWL